MLLTVKNAFEFNYGLPRQSYILVAGYRSPGVCRVRNGSTQRKWDVRDEGYGTDGGSTTYHGGKLARFDVDIQLWEPEQFLEWNLFARVLEKPRPGISTGLGISHPLINGPPLNVASAVVNPSP